MDMISDCKESERVALFHALFEELMEKQATYRERASILTIKCLEKKILTEDQLVQA